MPIPQPDFPGLGHDTENPEQQSEKGKLDDPSDDAHTHGPQGAVVIQGLANGDDHGHKHPHPGDEKYNAPKEGDDSQDPDNARGARKPDGAKKLTVVRLGLGGRQHPGTDEVGYEGPDEPADQRNQNSGDKPAAASRRRTNAGGKARQRHHPHGLPHGGLVVFHLFVQTGLQFGGPQHAI